MADFERARLEQLRAKYRRPTIDITALRDVTAAPPKRGGRRRGVAANADRLAGLIAKPAHTKRPRRT